MPVTEAVDAVLQIITGLEAALAVGVLHRDVKPSNCFIAGDGSVKVGDFGLSRSTFTFEDSLKTAIGSFMGTPGYAPPEQILEQATDVRSDIYSVGITLYYLLAGQTPFRSKNLVHLIAMMLETEVKSLATLRPEIPDRLCQTVLRCLAKQPEKRIPNYPSLREQLLPFSSLAATPAPWSRRILAGLVDGFVMTCFMLLLGLLLIPVANTHVLAATPVPLRFLGAWSGPAFVFPVLRHL